MGRITGEQVEPEGREGLLMRLVYMILIGIMLSFAGTALHGDGAGFSSFSCLSTAAHRNERLAELGTDLGIWNGQGRPLPDGGERRETLAPWTELD